jgi:hypothetical protein
MRGCKLRPQIAAGEITTMAQTENLSPRLQALKDELVRTIPIRKAADRATLESKPLNDVVIQYLTWKERMIRPRPRTVIIWPEVTNSPHYSTYKSAIERIKADLEAGKDMNAISRTRPTPGDDERRRQEGEWRRQDAEYAEAEKQFAAADRPPATVRGYTTRCGDCDALALNELKAFDRWVKAQSALPHAHRDDLD